MEKLKKFLMKERPVIQKMVDAIYAGPLYSTDTEGIKKVRALQQIVESIDTIVLNINNITAQHLKDMEDIVNDFNSPEKRI